jgi:hypothetical protein
MTLRCSQRRRARRRFILRALFLLAAALLLAGGALLVWIHQVGLPRPLAAVVEAELRQMGWEAEASRLQVRWNRGLVARDLSLRQPGPDGYRLQIAEVALRPDWSRLVRGDFELASLNVLSGRLALSPQADAAEDAIDSLVLSELSGTVTVLPGGAWQVEDCRADLLGFEVSLAGVVTNLAGVGRWSGTTTNTPSPPPSAAFLKTQLRTVTDFFRNLALEPPPSILVKFHGDAARPDTIAAELDLSTPLARTPWGRATGLHLNARLNEHPPTNELYHARLVLESRRITAAGVEIEEALLHANLAQTATNPLPSRVLWQAQAGRVRRGEIRLQGIRMNGSLERTGNAFHNWQWGFTLASQSLVSPELSTGTNSLTGRLTLDLTHPSRAAGELSLAASNVQMPQQGRAAFAALTANATPTPLTMSDHPEDWGFWRHLAPWAGGLTARLEGVESPRLATDLIEVALDWHAPKLERLRLRLEVDDESLEISDGRLDVDSREVSLKLRSDFDVHRLDRLMPPKVADWLAQFTWEAPPRLRGECRATLPPWSGPMSNLEETLLPTVWATAEVSGERAAYRGVPFDSARLKLGVGDSTLRLRDMRLERPEGRADLEYTLGMLSREFHWQLDCRLNPGKVAPAIDDEVVRILSLFDFTNAAHVRGDAWGSFRPPRRTELALAIDATDFHFRGESCDLLSGTLLLTNRIVTATNALVRHGNETARVERLDYAVDSRELRLTNGFTRMDPMRVARMIGPEVESVLAPYTFRQPPEIHLGGFLPTDGNTTGADMRFDVVGGPLQFWRFNFSDANGRVRWLGTNVTISDFDGGFYSGRLKGDLKVRMSPESPPNLAFDATVTNASLRTLVQDVFAITNHLEGVLSGHVVVTNGLPNALDTWFGNGSASLRNGLLWDLPVFGIISRALNVLSPGLGNNVATAAEGTFTLDAGVLHTQDTGIESKSVRLVFNGACSLTGELDARVVAEVMRRTPIVGPFVSAILSPFAKVFELRLSGRLSDPNVDLAHVPFLTTPVGLFKSLFQPGPTNPLPPSEPPGDEPESTPSPPAPDPR